jgi:hypothetical protein
MEGLAIDRKIIDFPSKPDNIFNCFPSKPDIINAVQRAFRQRPPV